MIKTGFRFKEIHSRDMDVTVETINRPILPAVKVSSYSPQFCDGTIDFSDKNDKQRYFYEDRIFELALKIRANDINSLISKSRAVSMWLQGSGDLIFDDSTDRIWQARVLQGVDFAPQILGSYAVINVQFRVMPFAKGIEEIFSKTIAAGTHNLEILTYTDWYVKPKIRLQTQTNNINTIKINDFILSYYLDEITINCETEEVYTDSGLFITNKSNQKFIELSEYQNSVLVTTPCSITITFKYAPLYF